MQRTGLVSLRDQLPLLKIQIGYNIHPISQVYETLIIGYISISSLLLVGEKKLLAYKLLTGQESQFSVNLSFFDMEASYAH